MTDPEQTLLTVNFNNVFSGSTTLEGKGFKEIYEAIGFILNKTQINEAWLTSLFGYSGFDVVKFRAKMIEKVTGEDLLFLVLLFLMRGNNLERIQTSTASNAVVNQLESLKSALEIQKSAKGKVLTVTLSRIAIAFPEVVGRILTEVPDLPGPVSTADIRSVTGMGDYPALARQSALACMVPRGHANATDIMNVFLLPNMMISEVINAKNTEWPKKTNAMKVADTIKFQKNALVSRLFDEDHRVFWSIKFGILNSDKSLTSAWKSAAEVTSWRRSMDLPMPDPNID